MAQVLYNSKSKLPCGCTPGAGVILCVSSSIVAPTLCPNSSVDETYSRSYIEATVLNETFFNNSCFGSYYAYLLQYDSSQLVDGTVFNSANINGIFCQSCLTQWMTDVVGNEPLLISNNDGSITYTSPHGCDLTFFPGNTPPSQPNYSLIPAIDATYDLGSGSNRWRDLYLSRNAAIGGVATILSLSVGGAPTVASNISSPSVLIENGTSQTPAGATNYFATRNGANNAYTKLLWADNADNSVVNSAANLITNIPTGFQYKFQINSGDVYRLSSTAFTPNNDYVVTLGMSSAHFNGLFSNAVTSNSSNLTLSSGTGFITSLFVGTQSLNLYKDSSSNLQLKFDAGSGGGLGLLLGPNTGDGSDVDFTVVAGGGLSASGYDGVTRGAFIGLYGNEHGNNGSVILSSGNNASAAIIVTAQGDANIVSNNGLVKASIVTGQSFVVHNTSGSADVFSVLPSGQIKSISANETTAAGTPTFGSNCPAVTVGAPNTWLKFTKSDGSQLYVPAWK